MFLSIFFFDSKENFVCFRLAKQSFQDNAVIIKFCGYDGNAGHSVVISEVSEEALKQTHCIVLKHTW